MERRLLNLVKNYLKYCDEGKEIDYDEDLKNLGLDSIASIQLLIEIEEEFDIVISDEYLTDSTFSTLSSIINVVNEILDSKND